MQLSPVLHPYPSHYGYQLELKDGTVLDVRPICPEDEPLLAKFHFTLSDESVYRRYFGFFNVEARIRHERLTKLCCIDYEHEMAFIALLPGDGDGTIIGVGRLIECDEGGTAEVAAVISDRFQHQGIGSSLVRHLVDFARERKMSQLTATVLPENRAMQRLLERQGFKFVVDVDNQVMKGQMPLQYA